MNRDLAERVAQLEKRLAQITDDGIKNNARLGASIHVALLALCDLLVAKGIAKPQELADRFHALSDEVFFHEKSEAASSFLDELAAFLRRAANEN